MKGKAARVSCRETRFLPAGSLPGFTSVWQGKSCSGSGSGVEAAGQWDGPCHAMPLAQGLEGWPCSLGSILLDFA